MNWMFFADVIGFWFSVSAGERMRDGSIYFQFFFFNYNILIAEGYKSRRDRKSISKNIFLSKISGSFFFNLFSNEFTKIIILAIFVI